MKKALLTILGLIIIGGGVWYLSTHKVEVPGNTSNEPKLIATVDYLCNAGNKITASLYEGTSTPATTEGQPPTPTGTAHVVLSDGRDLDLNQTLSADGVRYANQDESFVFWSKGNGAMVLENNQEKSYIGCIMLAPQNGGANLPEAYANSSIGFSLRLPSLITASSSTSTDGFKVDEKYSYQLNPKKKIAGVKFTIPKSMATGTNLASDTALSVESIPQTQSCTASLFLDGTHPATEQKEGNTTYSVATSSGAGAGNRYEETVYAIPGTNPCLAVRYLVHYGAIQNYPEGAVKEFDRNTLMATFDQIRQSMVVSQ